jgi:hypothetical protein
MNHFVKLGGMVFNINNILLMPSERGNGYKLLFGNKEILMSKQYADLVIEYIQQATSKTSVDICFNNLTPEFRHEFSNKERNEDLPVPETYEQRMRKSKQELVDTQNLSPFKSVERTPKPSEFVELLAEEERARNRAHWETKKLRTSDSKKSITETEVTPGSIDEDVQREVPPNNTFIPKTYSDVKMAREVSDPNATIERL